MQTKLGSLRGDEKKHIWRFMGSYKRVISRASAILPHIGGLETPLIPTHA